MKYVPYIQYLIQFKKDTNNAQVQALIDSGSKENAIHPTFAKQLGLSIKQTDVGVQKIDDTMLDIYGLVVAVFLVIDKANRVRFFEETFLMANISPEVVLRMYFLTLSDADIDFSDREL